MWVWVQETEAEVCEQEAAHQEVTEPIEYTS